MTPILNSTSFSNVGRPAAGKYRLLTAAKMALLSLLLFAHPAFGSPIAATPQQEEPRMASPNSKPSKGGVSDKAYANLLKKYVQEGRPGEPNRVDYAGLTNTPKDRRALETYVQALADSTPSALSKDAQFAFWANLYNALTIKVVLDYYPVSSIRKINISPGLFAKGPWGKPLIHVEGRNVSLDDIEHKILRPGWKDPRVHYALNCASYGCPSLPRKPFAAKTLETQLEAAARDFINSPRGARIEEGRLVLSNIYDWYGRDFIQDDTASSDVNVISHLQDYADKELAAALKGRTKINRYEYIWALNDVAKQNKSN